MNFMRLNRSLDGGSSTRVFMVHVLEAGLTFLEANNPNNRPSVKGFNIINGQLAESSDGATFESRNPAILRDVLGAFPLSTKDDVNAALDAAHGAFPAWAATPAPTRDKSSATWDDCSWTTKTISFDSKRVKSEKR